MATTDAPPKGGRRLTQAEREKSADFDAENPGGDEEAQSLAEMQENGGGEEDDGQLFVLEHGEQVRLSTLYARNTPVEYGFVLEGKTIKGGPGMGLIAFSDPHRTLIVPGRAGKVEVDPTYDGDGNVEKVTVRAHFKPTMAYDSRTEAGKVAFRGE
jgi:hypothetical protein